MVYQTRASRLIKYHGKMLADEARIEAYRRAMAGAIKPGDVVVDLGCGTGILAFIAAELGAKKVYAIEVAEIMDVAKKVRSANGLEDRVELIALVSYLTYLTEKADVLVTETIGDFGLDEGILGAVIDARTRLLKPGGTILPRSIELLAAPIEAPDSYAHVGAYKRDLFGLDFSPIRAQAAGLMYQEKIDPKALIAEPEVLGWVDFRTVATADFRARADYTALRSGTVHGLGGWFRSEIAEGIALTNAPDAPPSSWKQLFLPLPEPLSVAPGARLRAEVAMQENGAVWRWSLVVLH